MMVLSVAALSFYKLILTLIPTKHFSLLKNSNKTMYLYLVSNRPANFQILPQLNIIYIA